MIMEDRHSGQQDAIFQSMRLRPSYASRMEDYAPAEIPDWTAYLPYLDITEEEQVLIKEFGNFTLSVPSTYFPVDHLMPVENGDESVPVVAGPAPILSHPSAISSSSAEGRTHRPIPWLWILAFTLFGILLGYLGGAYFFDRNKASSGMENSGVVDPIAEVLDNQDQTPSQGGKDGSGSNVVDKENLNNSNIPAQNVSDAQSRELETDTHRSKGNGTKESAIAGGTNSDRRSSSKVLLNEGPQSRRLASKQEERIEKNAIATTYDEWQLSEHENAIIVGAFGEQSNAERMRAKILANGHSVYLQNRGTLTMVGIRGSMGDSDQLLQAARVEYNPDSWPLLRK